MNTPFVSRFNKISSFGTSIFGAAFLLFAFITTARATSVSSTNISFLGDNTPPSLSNLAVTTPIWENRIATLTGEIVDPDVDDTFILDIDWGDNMTQTLFLPAGTTVFTATQLYLDDNPSGTTQDDYTIQLLLQDDAGNSDTESIVLTVKNQFPLFLFFFPSSIIFNEGDPATALLQFQDQSPYDTFNLTMDWGDNAVTTYTYPASTDYHTVTHIYADDSPSGTLSDLYFLSMTWSDDDLLGGTLPPNMIYVQINNVAPLLSNLVVNTNSENGITTLTGTIDDPGILDTFTLAIDWDDNTVMTYTYPAGTTTFTETHSYTNLAGTLLPTSYTLSLTLTDDDGGQDTATAFVNNAPTITNLSITSPINESTTTIISGTFSDLDSQDTFTLMVDWGDGSILTTTYPAGTVEFTHPHLYLDDNAIDTYTITVNLMDNHGGTDTATIPITVNNTAPNLTTLATTSPINENDATNLLGTFDDSGMLDTFTVMVNWGDGNVLTSTYPAGATDFMHTHQYLDDPAGNAADTYSITVTLFDDDGGSDTIITPITVNNIAPTVDAGPDQVANDGTLLTFIGTFSDPGTLDTHTILWDFGDGITVTGTLSPTHSYAGPGLYTVTLTIADDDGGITQDTLRVVINEVSHPTYYLYVPTIAKP